MTTPKTASTPALQGVKVGDWLAREIPACRHGDPSTAQLWQVREVTFDLAILGNRHVRITTGKQISRSSAYRDQFRFATPEEVAAELKTQERSRQQATEMRAWQESEVKRLANTAQYFFDDVENRPALERLGVDRLRQIVAWIDEARDTKPTA